MHTVRITALTALAGSLLTLAACGGERTFDAEEFVAAANDSGAALTLGESLSSETPGVEVFAITLAGSGEGAVLPPATGGPGKGSGTDVHGGGSMAVSADPAAAQEEFQRCETAPSLVCFRAANVVLRFEDSLPPADLARIGAAIKSLESR